MQILAIAISDVLFKQRRDGELPTSLRIYGWSPISMSYLLTIYREDLIPQVEEIVARDGVTFNEAAFDVSYVLLSFPFVLHELICAPDIR